MKIKISISILFILIIIFNIFFYFSYNESKKQNLIKHNKLFEIIKNNESYITTNDIDDLNSKFNNYIPNFSILFFDISNFSKEYINEISNIIFLPRFGFNKINKKSLDEIKKLDIKNIYLRIFLINSEKSNDTENLILYNENDNNFISENESSIIIDISKYFPDELNLFFEKLQILKKKYDIDFYIKESDLKNLNEDIEISQYFINKIVELRPLFISYNNNPTKNVYFFEENTPQNQITEIINKIKINSRGEKRNILIGIDDESNYDLINLSKSIKDIIYNDQFSK